MLGAELCDAQRDTDGVLYKLWKLLKILLGGCDPEQRLFTARAN
jgi:hypothetical protein